MKTVSTPYGELTPQHTSDDLRKREIMPVEHHPSGNLKSVPLETRTVIDTPVGAVPAELVSFHDNGMVNRIFPLNGKLSGYWSQEDEAGLAEPVTLTSPIGVLRLKVLAVSFFENGGLRSLTLWPGETVSVPTPAGEIEARIGVSFTPDGQVASLEPARPTPVPTLAGPMNAYDPDAVGINGDDNSLRFAANGEVSRVITTLTRLTVVTPDGRNHAYEPEYRDSLCGDTEKEVVPMTVCFGESEVLIRTNPDAPAVRLPREGHVFFAEPYLPQLAQPFASLRCSI